MRKKKYYNTLVPNNFWDGMGNLEDKYNRNNNNLRILSSNFNKFVKVWESLAKC